MDLYSNKKLILLTLETLLAGDRVFVGNQPDDFGIAGTLSPGTKVLVLGLGYGGALRAILAGIKDAEITALDYDLHTIKTCSSIFEDFFPNISKRINYIHGDAAHLENYIHSKYDTVIIDLYNDEGYPDIVFQPHFWNQVKKVLSPQGIVLFNCMGLPTHLYPLEGNTPQTRCLRVLKNEFNHVYLAPYRRSLSIIASESPPSVRENSPNHHLKTLDKLILDLFQLRWKYAEKLDHSMQPSKYTNNVLNDRSSIDNEMINRWPNLIDTINKALTITGYPKLQASEIIKLVYDPVRAKDVTKWLLIKGLPEADFIPNAVGTLAFSNPKGLEWYPYWLITEAEKLIQLNKKWFINTALWQSFALLTNPFVKYDSNMVKDMVTNLKTTVENHLLTDQAT